MGEIVPSTAECLERIRKILAETRAAALQTVNTAMIAAYWEIGREIVEEEQRGEERAAYGAQLIRQLSDRLTAEFGKGFGPRNLRHIRQFYLAYADRGRQDEIRNTASAKSARLDSAMLYERGRSGTSSRTHASPFAPRLRS